MTVSLNSEVDHDLRQLLFPVALTQLAGRTIVSFSEQSKVSISKDEAPCSDNFYLGDQGLRALDVVDAWALSLRHSHPDFFSRYGAMSRAWHDNAGVGNIISGALASWQLRRSIGMLSEHLNCAIELDDIATKCGISRAHFAKAFRRSIGVPPYRWRLELRLALARQMLVETAEPLPRIARSFGFQQTTHFCHAFVSSTGMSPRQWRQTFRSNKWFDADQARVSQLQTLQMDFGDELFVHLELVHSADDHIVDGIRMLLTVALRKEEWTNSSAEVLAEALQLYSSESRLVGKPIKSLQGPLADWQVTLARQLLSRVSDEENIATVAAACGTSPSYFSKAFRATVGMCPSRWQATMRVERAKALLEGSSRLMIDIAGECGFSEQSHFNHTFTRLVGCNPGTWRNRHQGKDEYIGG